MQSYQRTPGRPNHPRVLLNAAPGSLPIPGGRADIQVMKERVQAEVAVRQNLLVHQAADLPVDLYDFQANPNLFPVSTIVTVLAFRVPIGRVLELTALAVEYQDPILHECDALSWRVAVNDQKVPNFGRVGAEFNPGGFGQLADPQPIASLFVQADSTLQIQVVTFDASFAVTTPYVVIGARIQGYLRNIVHSGEVSA